MGIYKQKMSIILYCMNMKNVDILDVFEILSTYLSARGTLLSDSRAYEITEKAITKTSPCNEDSLTPHFYIVKLGLTGDYIFFLFLL